jgi:tRNA-uridine aminocarboxypropyltransferase
VTPNAEPGDDRLPRARCNVCHKPRATCLCAHVPRIENRTPVWVIQHPRERFHPIGTARLLELSLARVRVDVAFLDDPRLALTRRPAPGALLLYPDPEARPLSEFCRAERPQELVVLDGTWHHAHCLQKKLGFLSTLPRVRLTAPAPSRYRIRREPRSECVSTLEAVSCALRELEPDLAGIDRLDALFDRMIDRQLEFVRARPGPRHLRAGRPEPWRALPWALGERFEDLVVSYVETAPDESGPPGARRIVQLVALRVASGELFEALVRGPEPLGLRHMGLESEALAQGIDPSGLEPAWHAFRRAHDVVAAWNQSTLDALAALGLERSGISLKAVYANASRTRPGTLDATIEREDLPAKPLPLRGRSAGRLANAVSVALALRAHGARWGRDRT